MKLSTVKLGHRAYLALNACLVLGAAFAIWQFTQHTQSRPAESAPITQEDFDKSLSWLDKGKEETK